MPQVVAAVIQIVKVVAAVAKVVSVVSQIASFFVKPKNNNANRGNRGLTLMVRETDYPRRLPYGRSRLGGIWFYAETTGRSNDSLWLVLGVGDGVTYGPAAVFFGEDRIELEVNGQDSAGRDIYEPANDQYVLRWRNIRWGNVEERIVTQSEYNAFNAPGWFPNDGNGNGPANRVPGSVYYTEKFERASSPYRGLASFSFYKGDQTTADARLVEESAGNWTASCKLLGISYAVVKLDYDSEVFATGVPEISFLWDGQAQIFDPRDDSTSYSNNAALCLNHYVTLPRLGPNADYATEINEAALTDSANACDETVPTLAGEEKRYYLDGVVSCANTPEDNIASMLTAMGGFTSYTGGRFTFGAGVWRPATFEIDEDLIVKIESFQNRVPKRSRVNTVKGLFVSDANLFQSSDFPTRTKASYVDADGEELVLDLDLQFTGSPTGAQRLANIKLEELRLQRSLQIECKLEAFRAQAGKNVLVTIPRYGLNQTPFEVETFAFVIGANGELNVKLALSETASSVYDWTSADELPVTVTPNLDTAGLKVASIVADPAPGQYLTTDFPMNVTLSSLTPSASIRWSKSLAPENVGSGSEYVGPVSVTANDALFSRAFRDGYADSDVLVGVYSVEQVERPTLTPNGGTFASFPVQVNSSTSTPGASIRWKLGSEPADETDGNEYTTGIDANDGDVIFVRAFKPGLVPSESSSATFSS